MFARALVTILTALLVGAPHADAHRPVFLQPAPQDAPEVRLGDATTSWAVYGSVRGATDTRTVAFTLREGDELFVQLLIPDDAPEATRPAYAQPSIGLAHAGHTTSIDATAPGTGFYEPFSMARYRRVLEYRRREADGGRYLLSVHAPRPARFVLVVGRVERFGPRDIASLPTVIGKVQAWARATPETASSRGRQRLWVAIAWALTAMALGLVGGGTLLLRRRLRSRRERSPGS